MNSKLLFLFFTLQLTLSNLYTQETHSAILETFNDTLGNEYKFDYTQTLNKRELEIIQAEFETIDESDFKLFQDPTQENQINTLQAFTKNIFDKSNPETLYDYLFKILETHDNKPVGVITFNVNETKEYNLYIRYLTVKKEYREKGLASNLLKKVEKFLTERKGNTPKKLTLCVSSVDQHILCPFYEKRGFKKINEDTRKKTFSIKMEKRIPIENTP